MERNLRMNARFARFVLIITLSMLSGCMHDDSDGTQNDGLPATEFSGAYVLADFTLSDTYAYWEIRRGEPGIPEIDYIVIASFDEERLQSLTDAQLEALAVASADIGFRSECEPGGCPVYGVAIKGDFPVLITSDAQLLSFFGQIDTPAELSLWLTAHDYTPVSYEETAAGYLAVADWDNLCGTRGSDLLFVGSDGVITVQRTLSQEELMDPVPCV